MREKGEEEGFGDGCRLEMEREEEGGVFFGGDGLGREGEEEDLEGVIPQGPSGNSIGFWFPSQRNLFFAKSEKSFCKIKNQTDYFASLFCIAACAAASLAIGTRNGEQLT